MSSLLASSLGGWTPPNSRAAQASDLGRLLDSPSVRFGNWPTPIDVLTRRDSLNILVKRDDLSGHGRGGAKARKIEHLVGLLIAHGYDELITVAGNVTNLVFDLLPVLERYRIRSRLFILDDPPIASRDRSQIFSGIMHNIELLGRNRAQALAAVASAAVRSRLAGRRPFVALPGLAHPAAVVGNALGFIEMVAQCESIGARPGGVFVTAATGTTLAGFVLAAHALRIFGVPPVRVVGVQVYPGAIRQRTLRLVRWAERFLGLRERVPAQRIEIDTSALHGGFARFPQQLPALCERVAADSGLELDPIFGGKTWWAMEQHLQRARDPRPTLYWHCGYTPNWTELGSAVRTASGSA